MALTAMQLKLWLSILIIHIAVLDRGKSYTSKTLHICGNLHFDFYMCYIILIKLTRNASTSLYEDIILSIASAPEANKFRAVVKASVRSLTMACFWPSS